MAENSIPELSPEERQARKRAAQKKWRAANPEKVRAYNQKAYATRPKRPHKKYVPRVLLSATERARQRAMFRGYLRRSQAQHPERWRDYLKKYRATHKEEVAAMGKAWREANPELAKSLYKAWAAANPDKVRANGAKRRAQKRNAPVNDFSATDWRALCRAAGYRCAYCGKKCPFRELTQDHITPLSKGGSHTLANIVPACGSCNSKKKDRDVLKPVQPFLLLDDSAAD